ncbi:MAG: helix-turn-helix domain-containing protein [Eubacteriales bacterium]|nr:helix-turn-helix domain-containing protein [Eubacteriales bacterium]
MSEFFGRIKGKNKTDTKMLVKARNNEVMELCRSGLTREQIAERYGLHESTVQKICNENGIYFSGNKGEKGGNGIRSAWTPDDVIEWAVITNRLKRKADRIAVPTPEQAEMMISNAAGGR